MIGKKLIAASVAGAAFGAGALALTPSLAADKPDSGHHQKADKRARGLALGHAKGVIHATWTTRNGDHHEAVRGIVTAVSSSSITVKAKDGVSETYQVSSDTKVRKAGVGDKKGLDSISDVENGDQALVVGKDSHDATHVLARTPKEKDSSSSEG